MSLREYQAKRDFDRTREPAGRLRAARAKRQPVFVVQKHAASHLHYDFRLEMEGVLKSWAVPKGFPFKRGDRRLAVEVEDHPIEYGTFEGTIPKGNYGAGTVMLWDRGSYRCSGGQPLQAWKAGKLHLTLSGKKLKGEWTLVRMRPSGNSKPQWLLLKSGADLSGLSPRSADRSVLTGRSLEQIAGAKEARQWISNRETRSGPAARPVRLAAAESTSHRGQPRSARRHKRASSEPLASDPSSQPFPSGSKVVLSHLPARDAGFVEPMKALLVADLPKGPDWLYEIKFDGVRALAIKEQRSLSLVSRSAHDLGGKYGEILRALERLPAKQVVLDGEVVAVDAQGRSAFQLLQSYQSAGSSKPPLLYYVFDLIQLNGQDLTRLPLQQRKQLVQELIGPLGPTVRYSGNIDADSPRLMQQMRALGLEGLIAKKRDSLYESGRRSGAWVKFKWTNEQEFVIGGYTRPKGGRAYLGALLVGYYQEGRLRFAAKVGTGFTDQALKSLHQKLQTLVQPDCPFANLPERSGALSGRLGPTEMKRCTWVRPELVCQVRFAEWTRDLHLRQPAYLGQREDKRAREVVRENPT